MISGVSVVIPAYNEAQAVESVVRDFLATLETVGVPFEILVVDDGSTDDTAAAARRAGARIVASPTNLGYGISLRRGILQAAYEYVLICDADGTYPAKRAHDLIQQAEHMDMVVAARTGARFRGRGLRGLARAALLLFAGFAVGRRVPDVNSGFRIFRKDLVLQYFGFLSPGFSFTTGLTLAMMSDALAVGFIQIEYRKRIGASKVRAVRDTLRTLQILVQATVRHNPIKLFLAISTLVWSVALAFLVLWIVLGSSAMGVLAAASLLIGIQILCLGPLAEVLRSRKS